jgi:hypothetical protein
LQSISGVSAINPLVAFYDIHGGQREVLLFYFVPDTTRDIYLYKYLYEVGTYVLCMAVLHMVKDYLFIKSTQP